MSLKEIARRAGTSVSTVSRVLNNENYKCSDPELAKRIWQAAKELSYLPNAAARALQKGGTPVQETEQKPYCFDIGTCPFRRAGQHLP